VSVSSNGTPALVNVATPSNAMTVTGTFPTGSSPAVNDLIVCVVTLYGTAAATTIAQHSGTTGYAQALTITGTTCRVDYWTKTATGSDSAPAFDGTNTGGTTADADMTVTIYDLSDPNGNTPVLDTSGTGVGTTAIPAVTTSGNVSIAGELAICAACIGQGTTTNTTTWTTPANWTLAAAGNAQTATARSQSASYLTTNATVLAAGSTATVTMVKGRTTTHTAAAIAAFKSVFTPGPVLNQPCSQPAGFRTVLLRAGLAMASVIPLAVAAPPPPVTSGPPVPALTQPVSVHRTLPRRGVTHKRTGQGITLTQGPAVTPLRSPVTARVRILPRRGAAAARTGQGIPQTQGPPVTPLRRPVSAVTRILPPRGRVIASFTRAQVPVPPSPAPLAPLHAPVTARVRILPSRGTAATRTGQGIPQTSGPQLTPLRSPLKAKPPKPPAGYAQAIAVAGINPLPGSGVPFPPLAQPVTVRRTLPKRGHASGSTGAPVRNPAASGAQFPAWHGPFTARRPFPPRGKTYGNPGAAPQTLTPGPALTPLRSPVAAKRPPSLNGRAAAVVAVFIPSSPVTSGPPVAGLHSPAGIRRVLPPRGTAQGHPGAPVANPAPPQTGAPFPPLRQPVSIRHALPARGRAYGNPGAPVVNPAAAPGLQRSQPAGLIVSVLRIGHVQRSVASSPVVNPSPVTSGPQLAPLRSPVQGRRPLPAPGRAMADAAIYILLPPVTSGPPAPPLTSPVRTRITPPPRGRASGSPGAKITNPVAGIPAPPQRQPVTIRHALPARGRAYGNAGAPVANPVPAVIPPPLRSPVRARQPLPPRGRAYGNPGAPVRNPSPGAAAPALHAPVSIRHVLPPRGRSTGGRGAPVRNPQAGAPFPARHVPVSIRFTLPPRGRNTGNQGAPVNNPPLALELTIGSPYTGWTPGVPYTGWALGGPYTGWSTGVPYGL